MTLHKEGENMKGYIQHQVPILPVKDVRETLDFFKEKLGFVIGWSWEDSYASVYNADIELHFEKSETITPQLIYFYVKNADEVYNFYLNQDVKIISEIESKPWGMREFTFSDQNGHLFKIGHEEKGTKEISNFTQY